MLFIQVVLIVAVLCVGALLVRSTAGERHQAVRRILLGALVVLAVASILAPGAVTVVARAVGVGRGTDLLLYGLVVAFLGALVSAYRRQRALESRLTQLTRRLALDEAEPPALARARHENASWPGGGGPAPGRAGALRGGAAGPSTADTTGGGAA
ncbi:DUF2304 domain-containing protein, partial [Kineococcus sp. SYSU DK006]|uniref:DUF2304 domain-containing protein n=1 Tax=Kineococcus sp. SYSU DK006 TaxID=3383127 RepID=UPI003D7C57B9